MDLIVRETRRDDVDELFEVRAAARAHGFYRFLGGRPSGKAGAKGDEILMLPRPESGSGARVAGAPGRTP